MEYVNKVVAWLDVLVDTFIEKVPYSFYIALFLPYVFWILKVGGFLFVLSAFLQGWTMLRLYEED